VVAALKIHQIVAETAKYLRVALVPFPPQVLANQIEYGGDSAEIVVFLNMELQAFFVHAQSMP